MSFSTLLSDGSEFMVMYQWAKTGFSEIKNSESVSIQNAFFKKSDIKQQQVNQQNIILETNSISIIQKSNVLFSPLNK